MAECRAAFYARVSSEAQARDHTIASQVAALRERVAADGAVMVPDHAFLDEGHSGSSLVRPALERLRDAVAAGEIDRVYVLAPDRLARRHAHQALLMEELRRAGVEVTFLNRPIGAGAEDDLLLQIQGVIAEYERAQILERSRRGRRHAARSGAVSALAGAPYGYRYITRERGGGAARFEIVPEEARFVRLIFAWVGLERVSLREVCRRLQQAECRTRSGATRWWASTIHGMIENPAYTGTAMYGRFHAVEPKPRLRPVRNHPPHASRPMTRVPVPAEEWVAVPVPIIVDPAIAEAARAQLAENRRRKREQCRGPGWLLQGLVVCRRCGYAYYGKATPGLTERHRPGLFGYGAYRCIGSDGYRFDGQAVCANPPVRSDRLERAVWAEIEAVLNDPQRIAHEYQRRLMDLAGAPADADVGEVERRMGAVRRGIGRLIDGYADGLIERAEFEPRLADLRARVAQLEEHRTVLAAAAEARRDLTLVIGRLEDFSIKVRANLDLLDWAARREVIRLMVRRIEIDHGQIEIVFRIPPPSRSESGDDHSRPKQHCTAERRPPLRRQPPDRGVLLHRSGPGGRGDAAAVRAALADGGDVRGGPQASRGRDAAPVVGPGDRPRHADAARPVLAGDALGRHDPGRGHRHAADGLVPQDRPDLRRRVGRDPAADLGGTDFLAVPGPPGPPEIPRPHPCPAGRDLGPRGLNGPQSRRPERRKSQSRAHVLDGSPAPLVHAAPRGSLFR
jgi:site-specific DNA recombinase